MSKYVKIYNEQGLPLGFKGYNDVSSAIGDANVKLYDDKGRLVGVSESLNATLEVWKIDPKEELLASFGPFGFGEYNITLPQGGQDFILKTNIPLHVGGEDASITLQPVGDENYYDFLYDEEEADWYYDGEYFSGDAILRIHKQIPI